MILNVSRVLAVVLTLLVAVSAHPLFPPASKRGTLGVFIPSAEGLVVAADSRSLLQGRACDEAFKIIEGHRSVAVLAGLHAVYRPVTSRPIDPCDDARRSWPIVDFDQILIPQLAADDFDCSDSATANLAERVRGSVQANLPSVLVATARFRAETDAAHGKPNNQLLNVVIGQYERQTGETTICSFDITLADTNASVAVEHLARGVRKQDDASTVRSAGENEFIPYILHGPGRRYLSTKTIDLISKSPKIADLSADDALGFATDIIDASIRILATDPNVNGIPGPPPIGGPIDAVLLRGDGAGPERLRWK